jgi:serine/threonine protein kinase
MEFNNFQPLPEELVRKIFYQIASSVLHCHKSGVAHRDIKLENVSNNY